jgi:hypothetical protein
LLMIGSSVLVQLDLHALLPVGRPDLLPVNTAEQRDELAALHSRTSLARATNTSDKEMPSDAAVFRLTAM